MPSYKSNAQKVIKDITNRLKGIEDNVTKPILLKIANDLASATNRRIHNEGLDVNGEKIGEYSESYKAVRIKNNKKVIDYVNLSFTGNLSKSYQVEAIDDLNYGVGFINDYGAELSAILEEKYDKVGKIWGKTKEDERIAQEEYEIALDRYLKKNG